MGLESAVKQQIHVMKENKNYNYQNEGQNGKVV
jgi:hypothetical protein